MAAAQVAPALELEWVRQRPGRWNSIARVARKKYLGTIGFVLIVSFVSIAVFGPWISPYDPLAVHTESALNAPGGSYLLGTDELGRDILSRLIYGSRISL